MMDSLDATADKNVTVMHTLVMCDKMRDLRSIASELGISFVAVQSILIDRLGIAKDSGRWMSHMLTLDQRRTWRYF